MPFVEVPQQTKNSKTLVEVPMLDATAKSKYTNIMFGGLVGWSCGQQLMAG